ncbi:hypothetical protein CABS01_01375 [Colletotrichum abscissum]|uniref:uncharacterized protein n=1 Tax=Colletotrichum abscissum TaxID=1671311 RepID=UPI0027D6FD28|nr:uncharacterized protein CABS01_01375 [Colletotrichum abscissum]KAK1495568.1 hypothetical protein CABS01_01375 [Colletotrichum abscissum]
MDRITQTGREVYVDVKMMQVSFDSPAPPTSEALSRPAAALRPAFNDWKLASCLPFTSVPWTLRESAHISKIPTSRPARPNPLVMSLRKIISLLLHTAAGQQMTDSISMFGVLVLESHTGRSGTKKRTSHGPGQRRATLDTRAHPSACVEADLLDGVENSHRHDIRSKRHVPESRHRQVDGLEKQSMGQIP